MLNLTLDDIGSLLDEPLVAVWRPFAPTDRSCSPVWHEWREGEFNCGSRPMTSRPGISVAIHAPRSSWPNPSTLRGVGSAQARLLDAGDLSMRSASPPIQGPEKG
jgi:hypothetical protein